VIKSVTHSESIKVRTCSNRLNMSDTISISVSAAAIFSADDSWGRPPKRKDMTAGTPQACGVRRTEGLHKLEQVSRNAKVCE